MSASALDEGHVGDEDTEDEAGDQATDVVPGADVGIAEGEVQVDRKPEDPLGYDGVAGGAEGAAAQQEEGAERTKDGEDGARCAERSGVRRDERLDEAGDDTTYEVDD